MRNWGNVHPAAPGFITSAANQLVLFTLDTNDYSANAEWLTLPAGNIG